MTIKTPSMLGGPFIVAESKMLMTIPRYAAKTFQPAAPIAILELPFSVPPYCVKMYSHRHSGKKEAADWLQNRLPGAGEGDGVLREQRAGLYWHCTPAH